MEIEGKRDRVAFLCLGQLISKHLEAKNSISSEQSTVAVEFLKRKLDGSYVWPDREDTSVVRANLLYKIGEQIQDVLQASARMLLK